METYRFEKERGSHKFLPPRGAMSTPWIPEDSYSRIKLWKKKYWALRKAAPVGERLYTALAKRSRSSIYALSVRTLTKRLSEMHWLDARCKQSHTRCERACKRVRGLLMRYPLNTRTRHPLDHVSLRETAKDTRKCVF